MALNDSTCLEEMFTTHNLRAGGATAMWAAKCTSRRDSTSRTLGVTMLPHIYMGREGESRRDRSLHISYVCIYVCSYEGCGEPSVGPRVGCGERPEPTPRSVESGKVRFNVTHALWPARRSRAEGLGRGGRSPTRGWRPAGSPPSREREKITVRDRETARKKSCSSSLMNLCFSDERGEGSDGR